MINSRIVKKTIKDECMKKLLLQFSAVFILFAFIIPGKASAVNMSAGVYTWYTWWDFPEDDYEKVETDPGFVYGPTLSVNLSDSFSFTFVFLYGTFDADGKNYENSILYGDPVIRYTYDIDRYDSDTAINYKLNDYLKVYLGVKYSAFSYKLNGTLYDIDFDHDTFGPGAGLSLTFPVVSNIFIIANAGGLYLIGNENYTASTGESEKFDIKDYGYNTSILLAYYVEPASTSIALGGRYQYIKTEYDDGFENESKFYGITLSASYLFSL